MPGKTGTPPAPGRGRASADLWGSRVLFGDVIETVAVVLDPTGQEVQTVVYGWQPARFSRDGVLRYLRAAFRDGRVLVDEKDRLFFEYGPRGGQKLRVEGRLLADEQTRWRIVFRMDVPGPRSPAGE